MSNSLVLAATTAVLKNLLENGLVERGVTGSLGGDAQVTAVPPDRIKLGSEERPQLNLFLYQVTPKGLNSNSRYAPPPSGNGRPGAPLTLELYYLLTAYGSQDYHTEILLGCGIDLLHRTPVLSREAVNRILTSISRPKDGRVVPPTLAALAEAGVEERIAQVKILANDVSNEEMTNLWSSLQCAFRPSNTYKVAVTLTDGAGGPAEAA